MSVRHTPRLVPVLLAGVLAALTAAVIVALTTPAPSDYSTVSSIGYLTFVFAMVTLPLSAVAWLIMERRSRSHGRTYLAEPLPAPDTRDAHGTPETHDAQTPSPAHPEHSEHSAHSERTDDDAPR